MYTIKNNSINEIIIKNSKFITLLYKVYSQEDIKNYLKEVKYLFNTGKMGYYSTFCSIMTYSNSYKYANDRKIKRLIDKYWYNEK